MAKIIWTESAIQALEYIAEFIALDKPSAASNLVHQVMEASDRLSSFPESGRIIPELSDMHYREILIKPCRLLYKFDANQQSIFILNVVRQERDLLRYIHQHPLEEPS